MKINFLRLSISYFIAAAALLPFSNIDIELPIPPINEYPSVFTPPKVDELVYEDSEPYDQSSLDMLDLLSKIPKEDFVYGITKDTTDTKNTKNGCIIYINDSSGNSKKLVTYKLTRLGLKPVIEWLWYPLRKVTPHVFVNPDHARYDPQTKELTIFLGEEKTIVLDLQKEKRNLWYIKQDFHKPE